MSGLQVKKRNLNGIKNKLDVSYVNHVTKCCMKMIAIGRLALAPMPMSVIYELIYESIYSILLDNVSPS